MSQYTNIGVKAFTAGAAIGQYIRVVLTSGVLQIAGLTDREIGVTEEEAFASGEIIGVRLRTAQGTVKMTAIEAISTEAIVYTETDGKVQDTSQATSYPIGTALEAASGDGSIIEVLRFNSDETAES